MVNITYASSEACKVTVFYSLFFMCCVYFIEKYIFQLDQIQSSNIFLSRPNKTWRVFLMPYNWYRDNRFLTFSSLVCQLRFKLIHFILVELTQLNIWHEMLIAGGTLCSHVKAAQWIVCQVLQLNIHRFFHLINT